MDEGDFYYDELGRVVFTAQYHLKRGYCCGSGCRHCPYPGAEAPATVADDQDSNSSG